MLEVNEYFPLELSDFEYYAYRDETVENPMVMVLRIHIEGSLDPEIFRSALTETLEHHPLLRSSIDKSGPTWRWKLQADHKPRLSCTTHSGKHPPIECPQKHIDLKRDPGARFELRICPQRSILIAYFHHACVDGVGGIRFLADVFALYGQKTAASDAERPEVRWPDPSTLLLRGAIRNPNGHNNQGKKWTEWLRGPARFLVGRNYCIKARTADQTGNDKHRTILHTKVLSRPIVRQLKRLAANRQVSTNDLCMMVYLQQISQWTQGDPAVRDNDLLRILMPVSMRTPEHDKISAANVLSYVFQPFRRRDCRNPEALLRAIHRKSTEMLNSNEGAVLLRLFSIVRRVPALFWLSQKLQPSFATAVLANVGELKRVFGSRFPMKAGRVVAGNVIIQRIDGIAPLRKNTNVVISFGGYGGELILNLRANPDVMSADGAESFLNQVIERLTRLAETQSLSGRAESETNSESQNFLNTQTHPG